MEIKKLLNSTYPATLEQTQNRLQALLEAFTISPSEDILNLIYAFTQKPYEKRYTISDLATIFPELTREYWNEISNEIIAEDEVIWSCYDQWLGNPCTSKKEREKIFIDSGVSAGQAEEMHKAYLLAAYEEACKEGDEKRKAKIKSEYHWRYEVGNNQKIEQGDIDRARETPIEEVYPLNGKTMAKCPFHDDKDASMHITKNLFHCFGCNAGGSTIDFVMQWQNINFPSAVKFILHQ